MRERGPGVKAVAVASDPVNGPLLVIVDATGTVYAKQRSLSAGWVRERGPGVKAVAVASDPTNGPLLAARAPTGYWVKEGSLAAGWVLLGEAVPAQR